MAELIEGRLHAGDPTRAGQARREVPTNNLERTARREVGESLWKPPSESLQQYTDRAATAAARGSNASSQDGVDTTFDLSY